MWAYTDFSACSFMYSESNYNLSLITPAPCTDCGCVCVASSRFFGHQSTCLEKISQPIWFETLWKEDHRFVTLRFVNEYPWLLIWANCECLMDVCLKDTHFVSPHLGKQALPLRCYRAVHSSWSGWKYIYLSGVCRFPFYHFLIIWYRGSV